LDGGYTDGMHEVLDFKGPFLPHSDFGDPDCCGFLYGVVRGDQADLTCNE